MAGRAGRGVYAAQIEFDQAGLWLAEVSPTDGAAKGELARLVLRVAEESSTPALGFAGPGQPEPYRFQRGLLGGAHLGR